MIAFLYPWALAGLVAAAIPLLLHFRAQREPPTIVFPAVRYLRDASRQHQHRLRLRQWLLLLLRSLLVMALVFAVVGINCCLLPGIIGLVLGTAELAAIERGEAPAAGKNLARGGQIIGGISAALSGLAIIGAAVFFIFMKETWR